MDLHSDPLRDGVDFNRRQFPVRLAWACTIHKAQGATLVKYVLCLEIDCFSHGQYYTAITRGGTAEACGIRVPPDCIEEDDGEAYVRNVVDSCLLLPAAAAAAGGGETRGNMHSSAHASAGAAGSSCEGAGRSNVAGSPHGCFADVVAARKSDFTRPEHAPCMCCDGGDGTLIPCYCCPNEVHERCMRNARMASSSWAEPVRLCEHFAQRDTDQEWFVCPACYNDYHDLASVSKFCHRGYLSSQGVVSLWPCEPALPHGALAL